MRRETISIYTFDELPTEKAKEQAREWYLAGMDYHWSDESRESIQAFCARFGVTLRDWSVGAFCPFDYSTDATNANFRGLKLRDVDRDAMPTGYCLDLTLSETFFDEFERTGDAKSAFDSALHEGFKAWRDDMESQHEDEYIDEHLVANGYEFDQYGRRYIRRAA